MNFLKALFQKREKWIEFDTLYSIERLEQLRFFMVENHIPYKVRAALLPVPLNAPMPSCAAYAPCGMFPCIQRTCTE